MVCGLQAAVTRHTWQVLLMLYLTVYMLGYMANQTCAMAYLPELTDDDDVLAAINGRARVKEMSCMLLYMIVVAASQLLLKLDAVDTGEIQRPKATTCTRCRLCVVRHLKANGTVRVVQDAATAPLGTRG